MTAASQGSMIDRYKSIYSSAIRADFDCMPGGKRKASQHDKQAMCGIGWLGSFVCLVLSFQPLRDAPRASKAGRSRPGRRRACAAWSGRDPIPPSTSRRRRSRASEPDNSCPEARGRPVCRIRAPGASEAWIERTISHDKFISRIGRLVDVLQGPPTHLTVRAAAAAAGATNIKCVAR